MSTHVHVRLSHGLSMSEDGELVRLSRCRCGAAWTTAYWAEEADAE
ncbi:hypothetical protein [Streptosporangium pseudovulgare]|uniref:Uncharacterized protein n=1 Tax=Streptosporangium pseudovulgare TaxID=35765 RepID=A0ABQ2R4M2_9ACTN|nr:hypothetical protein [Streptosporangium pseudovulgare]GGQ07588.1 hypothetical protein GCM10010140_42300 [Streptosporangium pseudovulgare]